MLPRANGTLPARLLPATMKLLGECNWYLPKLEHEPQAAPVG